MHCEGGGGQAHLDILGMVVLGLEPLPLEGLPLVMYCGQQEDARGQSQDIIRSGGEILDPGKNDLGRAEIARQRQPTADTCSSSLPSSRVSRSPGSQEGFVRPSLLFFVESRAVW